MMLKEELEKKEIWKPIPNYEGLYEVSNLGRVYSLIRNKILKPINHDYSFVNLCKKSNSFKRYSIHRLVYFTFNPDADRNLQVNHINENKFDNRLVNLNLMTCKENNNWGTHNKKISISRYLKIGKPILQYDLNDNFIKEYISTTEAAFLNGWEPQNIHSCLKNKSNTAYGFKWKYK